MARRSRSQAAGSSIMRASLRSRGGVPAERQRVASGSGVARAPWDRALRHRGDALARAHGELRVRGRSRWRQTRAHVGPGACLPAGRAGEVCHDFASWPQAGSRRVYRPRCQPACGFARALARRGSRGRREGEGELSFSAPRRASSGLRLPGRLGQGTSVPYATRGTLRRTVTMLSRRTRLDGLPGPVCRLDARDETEGRGR